MTTNSNASSPEYNVNRTPAVQCPHDLPDDPEHYDCSDPAHRIAAMYQTHDRVNIEIYNDDVEVVKTIPLVKETDALDFMTDWIMIERDRGVVYDGPSIRISL